MAIERNIRFCFRSQDRCPTTRDLDAKSPRRKRYAGTPWNGLVTHPFFIHFQYPSCVHAQRVTVLLNIITIVYQFTRWAARIPYFVIPLFTARCDNAIIFPLHITRQFRQRLLLSSTTFLIYDTDVPRMIGKLALSAIPRLDIDELRFHAQLRCDPNDGFRPVAFKIKISKQYAERRLPERDRARRNRACKRKWECSFYYRIFLFPETGPIGTFTLLLWYYLELS